MVAVSGKAGNPGGVATNRSEVLARFLDSGPANSDGPETLETATGLAPELEQGISLDQGSNIGNGVLSNMRDMVGNGVTRLLDLTLSPRLPEEARIALDALQGGLGPVVDGRANRVFKLRESAGISPEACNEFDRCVLNLN